MSTGNSNPDPVESVVLTQSEREAMERKWWSELIAMSENDDVAGFYRHYAKYLEWNNVISTGRKAIHRMAVRAAELLS